MPGAVRHHICQGGRVLVLEIRPAGLVNADDGAGQAKNQIGEAHGLERLELDPTGRSSNRFAASVIGVGVLLKSHGRVRPTDDYKTGGPRHPVAVKTAGGPW